MSLSDIVQNFYDCFVVFEIHAITHIDMLAVY